MFKPLGKRVLVKLREKKQASSVLIVEDKSPFREADVLASNLQDVKAGDVVLVALNGCTDVAGGTLVTEDCVMGVFGE